MRTMIPSGRLRLLPAAAMILALAKSAFPGDLSFSGTVTTVHRAQLRESSDLLDSGTLLTAAAEYGAEESRSFVSVDAAYNGAVPSRTGVSLGEAWYEYGNGSFALTLGRQFIVWGKADGVRVTDILCPADFTALAAEGGDSGRLPIDGARARFSAGNWTADGVWIPLFTPAALPVSEDNPLTKLLHPATVTVSGMTLPVIMENEPLPVGLGDGEYALRLSYAGAALDAGVGCYYGWDDLPRLTKKTLIDPDTLQVTGLSIEGSWYRIGMIGADAGIPVGPAILRFETALFLNRYFEGEGLTDATREHQAIFMGGIDWMPGTWKLTAQYVEDRIIEPAPTVLRDGRKASVTASASKSFFRDSLNLSAAGLLSLDDFGGYGKLSAGYALDDALTVTVGADLFYGGPDDEGEYETYEELSSVFVQGSYCF